MRMARAASVVALGLLAGCSGSTHVAPPVQSPSTSSEGAGHTLSLPHPSPPAPATTTAPATGLRQVSSPGHVTDDMQLGKTVSCHVGKSAHGDPLPDPHCTPGALDPSVTQATIKVTICTVGWTAKVRPPVADTGHWKAISETQYGDPAHFIAEYDHLVPLELGGANSTSNLWPEPGTVPNAKDKVENDLRAEVCAGRITLHQAQVEIATDWTTAR